MRCLSYRDPWGYLVAKGIKPVDNRKWNTSFRGRIYIQVSKTFDEEGYNFIMDHSELTKLIPDIEEFVFNCVVQLNAGRIIGEVDVTACMRKNTENPKSPYGMGGIFSMGDQQAELEYLKKTTPEYFSPWFFGPFGLVHKNPELYKTPVPCKGRIFPHFFEPGPEVEAEIKRMKESCQKELSPKL
jgi:hypothetical protein